jgi:FMN reductase
VPSSSESALRITLQAAEEGGAETLCLAADELDLPNYDPQDRIRTPEQARQIEAYRYADGGIISSPG